MTQILSGFAPFVSTSALPEGAFHDYYYGGWQEVLPSAGWASEPYQGTYQGWEGVENAGIAIAEFANLILLPGRMCSNGKPVPITQPDFVKFAQALRATGMAEYNAAKTKNMDAVNKLSDRLTETCANCHDKYRPDSRIGGPKLGPEKRCTPGV